MSLAERLVVALLALALVGCGGRLAPEPSGDLPTVVAARREGRL